MPYGISSHPTAAPSSREENKELMRLFLGSHLFFEGRGKEWGLSLSSASTVAYRAVLHCVGWPLSPALKEVRKGKSSNSLCCLDVSYCSGGGKKEGREKCGANLLYFPHGQPTPPLLLFLYFFFGVNCSERRRLRRRLVGILQSEASTASPPGRKSPM